MDSVPYINIHTHQSYSSGEVVSVHNIYPGDGFAAFYGENYYSVGIHPWHVGSENANNLALEELHKALQFDHVIFIGEAGLDKCAQTDFQEQRRVFNAQVQLAEKYNYPVLIHCVKAFNELLEIHKKINPSMPWILHSYNGSMEMTQELEKRNLMFSFCEGLLKNHSKAIESFKLLPLHKLFFETDELQIGVELMYQTGAKLKNISLRELKKAVWENFMRIKNRIPSESKKS